VAVEPTHAVTPPCSPNGRTIRALTWAPLALTGAYLIALATQLGQIVAATYLDADAASAPVIGQLYGGSPLHREVVLGQMAWYSTLMFELATRWLPLHRQIWEAAPVAMALASAGLIAWGLWRVAGRWAAAVGAAIAVCAAPHTLHLLFSLNDHSPTWFSLTLLAGALVLLQGGGGSQRGRVATALIIVAVGTIVGVNMASDTLLIGAGVVPALLAAVAVDRLPASGPAAQGRALWRGAARSRTLGRGRALRQTCGLLAVAVAGDALTRLLMHHENVVIPPGVTGIGLAGVAEITHNFRLWWSSIAVLGNGEPLALLGQGELGRLGFTVMLQLLCAGLALAAVAALVPLTASRELGGAQLGGGSGAEPGDAANGGERLDGASIGATAPRLAWCVFWSSSALILSVGFIFSSKPVDIRSDRYLVGLVYAAAALVPLLAGRDTARRAAVSLGVAVFALAGLVTLLQGQVSANPGRYPTDATSAQVARIARREHLKYGYAGYWDAAPITWATGFAVQVFPVRTCKAGLCRYGIHYISSWYAPRPSVRTFLISDPTQPVAAPPIAALGKPSAVHHVDELTMYVYPYDIASRLR
jgi:hypothetical protein